MNFHITEQFVAPPSQTTKITEPSIDAEAKQKTLVSEPKEMSGNDVQSFVIVNDIDVEEELSKAQKEKTNYFKMLSMSFYGKVKSHSLEHQDSRDSQKLSVTCQSGGKSAFKRKLSEHLPSENKKKGTKMPIKQKTQENLKKSTLPVKQLQLIPENFRKRVISPENESIKVQSPVMAWKKYQIGNFTTKTSSKKDTTFFREALQRANTAKKELDIFDSDGSKSSMSPSVKSSQTKRSNSPRTNLKKASLFKLDRKPQKVNENIEEKTQVLDVEPSTLDIKPHDQSQLGKGKKRETSGKSGKGSRGNSKQDSRNNSSKNVKEKSSGTPNNSGRSLPSTAHSQAKITLRETLEGKGGFFEQEVRAVTLMNEENKRSRDIKKTEPKSEKRQLKSKESKNTSQEKKVASRNDKSRNIEILDLQDSEDEDISLRKDTLQKRKLGTAKETIKPNEKIIDRQKSPINAKRFERISAAINAGIGNWEMKMAGPDASKSKVIEKSNNESPEPKSKIENSPMQRPTYKPKTSSADKLKKAEVFAQNRTRKLNDNEPSKLDFTKSKDLKNSDFWGKSKEMNKTRPISPAIENGKGPFDLLDKLLSNQKPAKR